METTYTLNGDTVTKTPVENTSNAHNISSIEYSIRLLKI